MREITAGELCKILEEHERWIDDEEEGEKADLSGANLSYAELIGANLRGADLSEVLGLNIEQLGVMLTLYGAKLSLECRKQVKDEYPGLLEELVEEEEEEEE